MSAQVSHGGRVGICSRGQRVSPVIAVQWYPNDSWVATWFARGNPVSRPKTTLGDLLLQGHRSNGGQEERISTYQWLVRTASFEGPVRPVWQRRIYR